MKDYLIDLLKRKDISINTAFEHHDDNGQVVSTIELEHMIELIIKAPQGAQNDVKRTLEKLDEEHKSITEYFSHLSLALV